MEKLVVIPTYNERENISKMISKVMSLTRAVTICSWWTTARPMERERSSRSGRRSFRIVCFCWNARENWGWALPISRDSAGRWLARTMPCSKSDCDFSHNPDDLLRLTAELEAGADVAVGSRYSKGVTVVNWPMSRLLMSYCASRYVRIVTGMPVCDATAGFVGYKREVLAAIDFGRIEMVGYGFQIEMKYTAWKMGFRIGKVPIIFADRTEGTSKMSGGIFGEAFFGVLALPFRTMRPEEITIVALPGSVFLLCGR